MSPLACDIEDLPGARCSGYLDLVSAIGGEQGNNQNRQGGGDGTGSRQL